MDRAAFVSLSRDDLIALIGAQAEQIAGLEAKLATSPKTPDNLSLPPSKGQKPNLPDRGKRSRPGHPGVNQH